MPSRTVQETISYLLVQICRAHRGFAESELEKIGLHAGQEMFLLRLAEDEGQSQSQLAEKMCVQPPTINKMLSRMEAANLVERRMDAEDNRATRVYLTEQGHALQSSIENVWRQLEEKTIASLTSDEQILLRRLLLQVQANLSEGH